MTEQHPTESEQKSIEQLIQERRARRGVDIPEPPRRVTAADIARENER